MRLIPELILTALIAGVGFGIWADPSLPSALPFLLLCLGALAVAVGCRLFGIPAGPVLLAAAVMFGVWRAETAESSPLPVAPTGSKVTATALITDAPATSGGRYRFKAQVVEDADDAVRDLPVGVNLLVYSLPPEELVARRDTPFLRYGDRLRLSGSVERPEPIGDFDYAAWLESQGIVGVMWARQVELVSTGGGSRPKAALHRVRTALASAIQRAVPAPESGLAQALLLGIRSELPQPVKESFRTAGMSHLLAISGLHVGVVMALTLGAASSIAGRNNPWAVLTTALVVWGYAVLSGLDPPVVRAAIMGSLFLAQGLLGRGIRGLTALLLAGAVMVLIDPLLLRSLSFQLSFTAMAGVIVGLPIITALSAAATAPLSAAGSGPARWAQHGLSLLIASTVISTTTSLATLPLVAWHFGEIPLMSVPATILAMPAMPAALLRGGDRVGRMVRAAFVGGCRHFDMGAVGMADMGGGHHAAAIAAGAVADRSVGGGLVGDDRTAGGAGIVAQGASGCGLAAEATALEATRTRGFSGCRSPGGCDRRAAAGRTIHQRQAGWIAARVRVGRRPRRRNIRGHARGTPDTGGRGP